MLASDQLRDFYEFNDLDILDNLNGPISVVNHFALREYADYRDENVPTRSGLEAMLLYSQVSTERLATMGGRFVMQGFHIGSMWGEDDAWDLVVVANFPDTGSFFELLNDAEYRAAFVHRKAAVQRQRVAICSTIA